MKGLFITLEGTEGCGKSTQIKHLTRKLADAGHPVLTVREPGGTPIGEEIRQILKHSSAGQCMAAETELLLMNASRAQLVREVIKPALAEGRIVLCDRYLDSTIAYQGYGRGLNLDEVRRIVRFATGDLLPDLTLLLQVSLRVSEERRAARNAAGAPQRDRMEEADRSFFERVEQGYEAIAISDRDRVQIINAEMDEKTVEENIWRAVQPVVDRITGPGINTYKSLGEWEMDKLRDS